MADVAIPDPYGVAAQRKATALKAYQDAVAGINQRKLDRARQAGFKADFDPTTGALKNYQIDPGNRFGDFQMQLARHGHDLDSAYHDATARGIGHVGLGAQAETGLRYQQGAEDNQLAQGFLSDINSLVGDQGRAFSDYQGALDQADADALMQAIQNRLFNQVPDTPAAPDQIGNDVRTDSDPLAEYRKRIAQGIALPTRTYVGGVI